MPEEGTGEPATVRLKPDTAHGGIRGAPRWRGLFLRFPETFVRVSAVGLRREHGRMRSDTLVWRPLVSENRRAPRVDELLMRARQAKPMIRRLALLVTALAVMWSIAAAQTTGVHPISGRRFAEVMDASGASWLDRRERDVEEAPDDALDIIGVKKGCVRRRRRRRLRLHDGQAGQARRRRPASSMPPTFNRR